MRALLPLTPGLWSCYGPVPIGHPTLKLIRVRIGGFELGKLPAGKWRELEPDQRKLILG